jgi:hypothetical protein
VLARRIRERRYSGDRRRRIAAGARGISPRRCWRSARRRSRTPGCRSVSRGS